MVLDVFAEETCGRENHYASDFLAAQICRTKTVCLADNLYSYIHSFDVLPDFFTDNGQITLRKHKTGKRNTNRMMFLFCFL